MIKVVKARVHNLKNLTVTIPRNTLTVITGVSGSGKSSLAFDTIHAEGQRRYIESLSAYARQFLEQMEKPDVETIDGLSPTIAIQQKTTSRNPRSTVGTVTEIYDYFRLLFAAIGKPHCPSCRKMLMKSTVQDVVDVLLSRPAGTRLTLFAPIVRARKGEYAKVIDELRREGFSRIRIDGTLFSLDDELPKLDPKKKHTLDIAVDRLVIDSGEKSPVAVGAGSSVKTRLSEGVELAFKMADGQLIVAEDHREVLFSEHLRCPDCEISIPDPKPQMFSFNSPFGACSACSGLGFQLILDPDLLIPDKSKSITQGAILAVNASEETYYRQWLNSLARQFKFSLDTPVCDLPDRIVNVILHGSGSEDIKVLYEGKRMQATFNKPFEGIIPMIERRFRETQSEDARRYYERYMRSLPCPGCEGRRLSPGALAITIHGESIHDLTLRSIRELTAFFRDLDLTEREQNICRKVLEQINSRLRFLMDVGLDYLTLARSAHTLSGGEAQRIRLATQIGSALVGITYVLDEPSIGLHARDNRRLIDTLLKLRDIGNTVLVVEHDQEIMQCADHIIDLGPGAGVEGGWLVSQGSPAEVGAHRESLTGRFLSGEETIPVPDSRRPGSGKHISLIGADHNNLKAVRADFPLGCLIAVTGVSGSGKSSLLADTMYPLLANQLHLARHEVGHYQAIEGLEHINKVVNIDQDPIGRTPRSNPATYTGVFGPIRTLFSQTVEARARGYAPGRFSFNVKGGRCETCEGSGQIQIEMHFLPDVYVTCEACKGLRFNEETLAVKFKGKSIAEVLGMTIKEGIEFFGAFAPIRRKLQTLHDVGLGYLTLGQPSNTLSGGEAQRVKLSTELSRVATGDTMYFLDEPTTGLHFDDVRKLLMVLQRLVDKGNTVVVIEHNLDVIKTADWLIDLGPEGGDNGGRIIAEGTPEQVACCPDSLTGKYLAALLTERPKKAPGRKRVSVAKGTRGAGVDVLTADR
jgi:excinuclease ABC subunit A